MNLRMQRVIPLSTLQTRVHGALFQELLSHLGPCDNAGWSVQQLCNVFVPADPPHFDYEHLHALLTLVVETVGREDQAVVGAVLVPKKELVCFFSLSLSLNLLVEFTACTVTH